MLLLKRLLLWTVLLHGLIFIGVQHAGGVLFVFEVGLIMEFKEYVNGGEFTLTSNNETASIGLLMLLSISGKLIAIIALLVKRFKVFGVLSFIALFLLWFSYYNINFAQQSAIGSRDTFFTGLPFLLLSVLFVTFFILGYKDLAIKKANKEL